MNNKKTLVALRRARQKGYGLIEIALGLAIAAGLVAAAMMYFGNASTAAANNDAMSEMAAIQQVSRSLYSGQANYTGLTSVLVAGSGQLPAKYVTGTIAAPTGITSAFHGTVTVLPATGSIADSNFSVELTNVPLQSCVQMTTTDLGTGMVSLVVGSGTAVDARAMTPTEANAACTGNANTITWTFF
jgi:type II secretory pathway pseudopilin PulG